MATLTAGNRRPADVRTADALPSEARRARPTRTEADIVTSPAARRTLAVTRYATGFLFIWAFVDKLFGLGFATAAERAWVAGGSPAGGFLNSDAIRGPFKAAFQSLAVPAVDWIFMLGLLGIGIALCLGIGLRVAAVAGTAMMLLRSVAEWPFAANTGSSNPLVDFHIVYALVMILFPVLAAGETWGLGAQWRRLPIVQRLPWLR